MRIEASSHGALRMLRNGAEFPIGPTQPLPHEIRAKGAQMRIMLRPAGRRFEVLGAAHERLATNRPQWMWKVWMTVEPP